MTNAIVREKYKIAPLTCRQRVVTAIPHPPLVPRANVAHAGDVKLAGPKLLPDEQELQRIIDLTAQTIVVLNPARQGYPC